MLRDILRAAGERRVALAGAAAVAALLAAGGAVLGPRSALAQPPAAAAPPALVVLLVVDQLRPDYLTRWAPQLTGGLGRLARTGTFFPRAQQDHAITQTAPGHSTTLSGRFPAHTGIITNARGVPDPLAPIIGAPDAEPASPRRFQGTTLYDWMLAADPGTRVLSASRKDRGAILPVGRARGDVYWYGVNGEFTTSRYYRDTLPGWVQAWNARRGVARLAGTTWQPLLAADAYAEPDSQRWENYGRDFVFPHRLPTALDSLVQRIRYVPWMDSLTLDLALEGVRQTGLGHRARPDLLVVSLSTVDAVGHDFGPDSRELHDQVLRTDHWLDWFLDSLATLVPRERTLFALTADHGVQSIPAFVREVRRRPSQPLWLASLARELRTAFAARFHSDAGFAFEYGLLLADTSELRARALDVDSLSEALAARVRTLPGIAHVYTPRTLRAAPASDTLARRWRHSIPPEYGWLFAATPLPDYPWEPQEEGNHGTPNAADVGVPIIFAGPGIPARRDERVVRTVDIAPTLAAILGVRPTQPLDGRPIPGLAPPRATDGGRR
ncbi:MAG TPA: alkaline phosphatase family protein [Gemmatimonadales bacterium]|nr:alkaline phosphatase family protein [Gemmatimonadales bacterium]